MTKFRDKAYYVGLITGVDPFGNPYKIEHDTAEEEQRTLMLKQQGWQLQMAAEALKLQFSDNPGQQAAIDSDFLLANQERQKNEEHSTATVVDAFIRDSVGRMEEQSLQDLRTGLNLLIHFAGDKPFNRLTKADLIRFKNLLPRVPAHFHSNKSLMNMPFEEAIDLTQKQGHRLQAVRTVEKKVDAVRQLFRWAYHSSSFIDTDYSGIFDQRFINKKNNAQKRSYLPFTDVQLKNLVNCYLYKGEVPTTLKKVEPHKFWVPMIALFTGARLEEICQLYIQDVVCIDGVWQFRITREDSIGEGKKVRIKTKSSERSVPIHSQLLSMGFIDYFEEIRDTGGQRLFPELSNKNQKQKYSFSVTKWFGDTLSQQIKYDRGSGYCFHSFRKNVIQNLQQLTDIPREVRKAVVGHSKGGGDAHEDYERAYDARVLDPILGRLEYPQLDFEGISWGDFKKRHAEWHSEKQNR